MAGVRLVPASELVEARLPLAPVQSACLIHAQYTMRLTTEVLSLLERAKHQYYGTAAKEGEPAALVKTPAGQVIRLRPGCTVKTARAVGSFAAIFRDGAEDPLPGMHLLSLHDAYFGIPSAPFITPPCDRREASDELDELARYMTEVYALVAIGAQRAREVADPPSIRVVDCYVIEGGEGEGEGAGSSIRQLLEGLTRRWSAHPMPPTLQQGHDPGLRALFRCCAMAHLSTIA